MRYKVGDIIKIQDISGKFKVTKVIKCVTGQDLDNHRLLPTYFEHEAMFLKEIGTSRSGWAKDDEVERLIKHRTKADLIREWEEAK